MNITSKMQHAIDEIRNLLSKEVKVISLEEAESITGMSIADYLGVCWQDDSNIYVGLSTKKPETNESSLLHEFCHLHIEIQKFPSVKWDKRLLPTSMDNRLKNCLPQLASFLQNSMNHPAVYEMMDRKFDVNMKIYFNNLLEQKLARFRKRKPADRLNTIFGEQQDIIDGYEYHFYDTEIREILFKFFKKTSEAAYHSCRDITSRIIKKYSILTADGCCNAGIMLLNRIKKYGEQRNLGKINKIWDGIIIN